MTFANKFALTGGTAGTSMIEHIGGPDILPGAYNFGLVVFCDTDFSESADLESWEPVIGCKSFLLAYTGFGDFFVYSSTFHDVVFVNVQRKSCSAIGVSLESFCNLFLTDNAIEASVLRVSRFQQVCESLGNLAYGDCFVLQPWPMLGGIDKIESYRARNFLVYIELVAQTPSDNENPRKTRTR